MKSSFLSLPRSLFIAIVALLWAPLSALAQQTITATTGQVGTAYSYQVTSTATPPVTYSASGLPAGLAINSTSGLITGTPTTAGTTTGTVSITNSSGQVNTANISVTINPAAGTPTISSAATLSGTVGSAITAYSITATVPSGAAAVTSFNVGALPAGLALGGTTTAPTISGTPTASGTYSVSLSANSASGTGASATLTITVAPAAAAPVISSATTAPVSTSSAFSYQITASNSPTSYSASGLPLGLSLNTTSGLISGTASVPGVNTVTLVATNAAGSSASFTLTLTVGSVSVVSSATTASGTVGASFSYSITGSNTLTSFNVGSLPGGLTANTTSGLISGTPTLAGVTSVTLSANNATGTGPSVTLVITIGAAASGGGGGSGGSGGSTGGSGGSGAVGGGGSPPVIAAQPQSQSVVEGAEVVFSVSATGTALNFQWSKNGTLIVGAQSATYSLPRAGAADAGSYTVYISNTAGAVTSSTATLTVATAVAPTITTQPAAASVAAGGNATLTVVAAGTAPLTYQWRKDGTAITGATNSTLSLSGITAAQAGSYSVVVTNSAGSATSNAAALTVTSGIAGTYFGSFSGNAGSFGLLVRSDRTGVFLGFAGTPRVALLSREVVVDANGRFSVTQRAGAAEAPASQPAVAAAEGDITITGAIAADGTLSGSVPTLNLTFNAPAAASTGSTSAVAGFYQAGAAGSSAQSLALVGPAGEAVVVTISGTAVDGGRGTVSAAGTLAATTSANVRVAGTVASSGIIVTAGTTTFAGSVDSRNEKLINISTRSLTGTATDTLIAGFVVTGTAPKPVLVRGIGPTLATLGVSGSLSAVRLEVFRGATSVAVGADWGAAANNPTEVAAVAARVGAFALPASSRDAALVLSLTPGNYSAVVTGQGGASGVALVEVYDATVGAIPAAQRVVNIATRATAGTGDNTLIAGFYVTGTAPKRVLVRGIGPGLTQFGVTGVLARPQLNVASGATVLAQNAGLSTSADAAAIQAAATLVGAFALPANTADSAILINLAPGPYTAQVSGVGATTGVALIEVYEVP